MIAFSLSDFLSPCHRHCHSKRICYCTLGFPRRSHGETGCGEFLDQIGRIEEFLKDPWLIRVCEGSTVQVPVPKVTPPPPPIVCAEDDGGDGAEELQSAQSKRSALHKKAAAASLAVEDFARRFESGAMVVASKDSTAEDQVLPDANVMCRLCFSAENDGSETAKRMPPCRSCGKKYHRSCLKTWSQHRDLFHWSSWTCPFCRVCEVCRRAGDSTKFKFCKRCDGAVHCYCMQPPHKNVSSGPYLCSKHTKCHSCGSNVPGNGLSVRWFLGYTCCDACGRLFTKGNYCPVCLKVYRDSESSPMVCCDICQRWVHCNCDGISDEKYLEFQTDGNLPYTCPMCRGECHQVRDLEDAVQELWKRRDEADKDLIATLRAAAGLPTQDEIFSISPFSDDEDDDLSAVKSEHGGVKLCFKSLADFSPMKSRESQKKTSTKKHAKKKGLEMPLNGKMEGNHEEHHDGPGPGCRPNDRNHDLHSPGPDLFYSPVARSLNPGDRICSTNEQGVLRHKSMDEVAGNNVDRKPDILQIKSKKDTSTGEDGGKVVDKAKNMKGPKLVIHLGGRNKIITNSPRSDSSSYQREQELTTSRGSEAMCQRRMGDYTEDRCDGHRVESPHRIKGVKPGESNIIKLGKAKSEAFDRRSRSGGENGLFSPENTQIMPSSRSKETSSVSSGLQKNVPMGEVSLRKHPSNRAEIPINSNKNNKQVSPVLHASLNDSRPLLRLKFKTPYPGSWTPHGEEETAIVKGQRSKRKRPSSLAERPNHREDAEETQDNNLMNEIMDANWILKKLGKDAVGKRVEVNQPSDNSWHKGVVSDVIEGTSMLTIALDDGRLKTLELGKRRIRFVPQKQKRLKS